MLYEHPSAEETAVSAPETCSNDREEEARLHADALCGYAMVLGRKPDWEKQAVLHSNTLHRYAMALSRNPEDAADLFQQTFAQAMPHFERLRPSSNVEAWLFSIMRNTWRKQLRRERSGPDYAAFDNTETLQSPDTNGPQALSIRAEQRENIRAALQQLPKVCSEVVVLCCIEEFSYKEAAAQLDCPIGTVMSRLSRARTKLERLLGPELE